MVIVPKSDGDVRICIDMSQANKAIVRENHPLPTLDDIWPQLVGATIFSRLDICNAAFARVWTSIEPQKKTEEGKSAVLFVGHTVSANGVQPNQDKLEAVKKFRTPESAEETRSFLGLVTYLSRFIPNLASLADPLDNKSKKIQINSLGASIMRNVLSE